MNKLLSALVPPLFVCLLPACSAETADETAEDEDIAAVDSAFLSSNGMVANALLPTALEPGALQPADLAHHALDAAALSPGALAAIQATGSGGDLSRMFLKYAVGCALDSTQSFSFSWTGSDGLVHTEQYPGSIGIAPGWATAPLTDETRQRLVSACLAARVNWYGVSVVVSIRSGEHPLKSQLDRAEILAFPHVEGAFWGNLFGAEPYLNACYHPYNVAVARAAFRDCAAGHVDGDEIQPCGPIALVGPCTDWCASLKQGGQYYPECADQPGVEGSPSTTAIITTALP